MEQAAKDGVRPFLGFPPFRAFPIFLVFRNSVFGDLQIHDSKKKLAPWDKALLALLVLAKVDNNARPIRLQNEMEHSWDLLSTARWCPQHLRRDANQSGESILNNLGKDVVLLAEPIPSWSMVLFLSSTLYTPERSHSLQHGNTSGMYLANGAAPEEGFDVPEEAWPSFREIVGNDGFESVGDLHGDATRWGCSEQRKDVGAEGFTV